MEWQQYQQQLQQYLVPAGDGVFAISSGAGRSGNLQQHLYGGSGDTAKSAWLQQLAQLPDNTKPVVLGVASDCGGGIQRGANWGPLSVREALYDKIDPSSVFELGDVRVNPHLLLDDYLNEATIAACREAMYGAGAGALAVSPLSITDEVAAGFYQLFPEQSLFAIGGDHSVSYPLVKQYLLSAKRRGKRAALIQFDAHTDLLQQRLGIPICFGSWTSHVLEWLTEPSDCIQIGIRASGKDKAYWQQKVGLQQWWAAEVAERGAGAIVDAIVDYGQSKGIDEIYITFDIDGLDSQFAGATGTPERGGLSLDDAVFMIQGLSEAFALTGADVVEVAPMVGHGEGEPAVTLHSASEVAVALLGGMRS